MTLQIPLCSVFFAMIQSGPWEIHYFWGMDTILYRIAAFAMAAASALAGNLHAQDTAAPFLPVDAEFLGKIDAVPPPGAEISFISLAFSPAVITTWYTTQ